MKKLFLPIVEAWRTASTSLKIFLGLFYLGVVDSILASIYTLPPMLSFWIPLLTLCTVWTLGIIGTGGLLRWLVVSKHQGWAAYILIILMGAGLYLIGVEILLSASLPFIFISNHWFLGFVKMKTIILTIAGILITASLPSAKTVT